MSELKLWTDDTEFYVAESAEHARKLQIENIGSEDDASPLDEWREFNGFKDSGKLKICESGPHGEDQTKTIAEWIAEKGGPGFLCSTEW